MRLLLSKSNVQRIQCLQECPSDVTAKAGVTRIDTEAHYVCTHVGPRSYSFAEIPECFLSLRRSVPTIETLDLIVGPLDGSCGTGNHILAAKGRHQDRLTCEQFNIELRRKVSGGAQAH